jgi:energy-coupling factor transporter ATP-binding protein EcfA2
MLIAAFFGALVNKYLPAAVNLLAKAGSGLIRKFSNTAASHDFRGTYLDWLVTENRDLRLAGIVTADETKKPTLEQVFVSLYIGKGQAMFASHIDDSADPRAVQVIRTWRELHEALTMHGPKKLGQHPQYHAWLRECRRRMKHRIHLPWTLDLTETEASDIARWINANHELLEDEVVGELQVRKVLRSSNRVAILGAPGSGKTTLLQHLALMYAREHAGDPALRTPGILMERLGETMWRLPILLRLSSIAQQLEVAARAGRTCTLLDIILALLPADLQTHNAANGFFRAELERGDCLIFLDGLDEVPSQHDFQEVVNLIRGFMAAYRENRFVVTSRIVGWRGGIGSDFDVFYVNDLTEAQVQVFVETWYSAVEKNAVIGPLSEEGDASRRARERRALRRAGELTATLGDNEGLRRLASNPMLLSIIALVHRSMATLPKERGKLYAECGRILLEQWDISRGVRVDDTHLKVEQKEAIMRRIAIALHRGEIGSVGGTREAATEEVLGIVRGILPDLGKSADDAIHLLNMLIARSGLLAERQRGVLAFTHHTFQEYFAARYLAATKETEHREFLLDSSRLWSDWWREVILLYCGSIDDASALLREMYERDEGDLFLKHLRVTAMCLGEAISCADVDLRRAIVHSLFVVRDGTGLGPDEALTPAAVTYLTGWASDDGWAVKAAQLRTRLWSNAGDEGTLSAALVAGLQNANPNERHAALAVIPQIDVNILSHVSRETYAAAVTMEQHDPVLASEVLGRLAVLQRSPETLAQLLDLGGATDQVIEGVIKDVVAHGDVTQAEWQELLRYQPRASRRVGAVILESFAAHVKAFTDKRREALVSAVQAVASENSAAGAIAMVLGHGLGLSGVLRNVGERLVIAADANTPCRELVSAAIRNHDDLQLPLGRVLQDPHDAEDVTGTLDVVADAFEIIPASLSADVRRYTKESIPEVRAAMARLLAKFGHDDGAVRLLLWLARNRNLVIRTNALCALAEVSKQYDSARRRALTTALQSRDLATRAAAGYAIQHMDDAEMRSVLVDSYVQWKRPRIQTMQSRWYEFVWLRYVIDSAAQTPRPTAVPFSVLWDAAIQHIDVGTAKAIPVESAVGDGAVSFFDDLHRRRRHLEHRSVRTRTNRVTLLEEASEIHLASIQTGLTVLLSRGSEPSDVARVAASITSTNASVRDFALNILTDEGMRLSDSDMLLIPIKKALDDRSNYVRLSGTAAVRGIAPRMTLSVGHELTSRLGDEDAAVRDAAWDVLAAYYSPHLHGRVKD